MISIDQQIPLFPSSFTEENVDAIDFSCQDIAAVASGSTISLTFVRDHKLHQSFSFSIGENIVTSLRFHPSNHILIIGDARGNLYAYDINKRIIISKPYSLKGGNNANYAIRQIEMYEGGLLVFHRNGQLSLLTIFQKKDSTMTLLFNCLWEISVPESLTNFTIEPFRRNRIFMYGKNTPTFQVYTITDIHKPAKPFSAPLELSNNHLIQNAQYSLHLQDYIFLVTEESLMFYNVDLSLVSPLSTYQRTTSLLSNIVQFPTDHTKLLLFHRSGSISLLHLQKPFSLFSLTEINHTIQTQNLISYKLSPLRDDYLLCAYDPLGLALLDITTFRIVSVVPLWCDKTTSFSVNGSHYVLGTEKGYISVGSLFNVEEKMTFQISDQAVTFVSLNERKNRLCWATNHTFGEISLNNRILRPFAKHSLMLKRAVGSPGGALAIQRDSCVLGIIIKGNEQIFTSPSSMKDFCFNDDTSSSSSGSVMVLLDNHTLLFFNYSAKNGVSPPFNKIFVDTVSNPVCCAWLGNQFAVGFDDGNIFNYSLSFNLSNGQLNTTANAGFTKVNLRTSYVCRMQYCKNSIFALTADKNIYKIKGEKTIVCASNGELFSIIDNNLLIVLSTSNTVYFIKLTDLKPLSDTSKALPIPDIDHYTFHFLSNCPVFSQDDNKSANFLPNIVDNKIKATSNRSIAYLTKEAREFWQQILDRPSLRQMLICAAGNSKNYDDTICDILLLGSAHETHRRYLYGQLLFADRVEEAVSILSKIKPSSTSFMHYTILATAAMAFEEDGITDEQSARLKSAGINLIMSNKVKEGSLLLRLAKLDNTAVEYLLQTNKIYEAMKFIRTTLPLEDKKEACFDIACIFYKNQKLKDAMLFFLTAKELHPALHCLFKLKRFEDAFLIKTYLVKNNMLKEMSMKRAKKFPKELKLEKLCELIDKHFTAIIEKRKMDPKQFGLSKSNNGSGNHISDYYNNLMNNSINKNGAKSGKGDKKMFKNGPKK